MTTALVVALKAEANPLIEHFRLKPLASPTLFPIWENETIKLVISGVGKIKAGAAVSYLAGIHRDEPIDSWLNIGIAGHKSLAIGTPLLIHKITDAARQSSFFPSFAFLPPCETIACLTIDQATADYPDEPVCEMEAAGFYLIAAKIAPLETIHLFKVISDNTSFSAHQLTKNTVERLIGNQIDKVNAVITEMSRLAKQIMPHHIPLLDSFLKQWHFTTCETQQLKKLLHRWQTLYPDQVILSQDILDCKTASAALALLDKKLSSQPLPLV
ncbi:MAG: hypothetical protein AAF443_03945 [Chlamydiota bacterium]